MNLNIIGETAFQLTSDFKAEHSSFNGMIGMCQINVHAYCQLKDGIVRATVETELLPPRTKVL